MKARRVQQIEERGWSEDYEIARTVERGDFEVKADPDGQRWFWFKCPGPCGTVAPLALRPLALERNSAWRDHVQSWDFDDNLEAPTLSPSINHVGCWHGWLRSGEFKPC